MTTEAATEATHDNRKTCTYPGDVRDSIGLIRGPNAWGELLVADYAVFVPPGDCYLTARPNLYGCHDPQCSDSTWDHECPTGPCQVAAHTTGVTRVWFRYAAREEVEDPDLARRSQSGATPLFDVPASLAGPLGYVLIACDGCGATIREYGITDTSKGWALCPDCLAKPDAHARIEAKRRENARARS